VGDLHGGWQPRRGLLASGGLLASEADAGEGRLATHAAREPALLRARRAGPLEGEEALLILGTSHAARSRKGQGWRGGSSWCVRRCACAM
jgi:hypothetical protein